MWSWTLTIRPKKVDLLKAGFVHGELILSRVNAREDINPCIVGSRTGSAPAVNTLQFHFGARHDGSRVICDQPRDRSRLGLGHSNSRQSTTP